MGAAGLYIQGRPYKQGFKCRQPFPAISKPRQNIILDGLDCGPSLQSLLAHVSPESTLLDSPEGNVGAQHRPRIHRDLARLKRLRDPVRPIDVVGEKCGTQPVVGIVRLGNHLLFGRKLGDALGYVSTRPGGNLEESFLTATGPKISSRMIDASSATSAKAVFCTKYPFSPIRSPPNSSRAPDSFPCRI